MLMPSQVDPQLPAVRPRLFVQVDYALAKDRSVNSFGEMKVREIARPAGNALNYIEALKLVRKKIRGE